MTFTRRNAVTFCVAAVFVFLLPPPTISAVPAPILRIAVDRARVDMGRSVAVNARASRPDGKPASGCMVLAYVNGRRWGAHEFTDAKGLATIRFPLPNPGIAEIKAELVETPRADLKMERLYTGRVMPSDGIFSNAVRVGVARRAMIAVKNGPGRLVGVQWEPWFTPHVAFWQTAQAVPVMGFYDSYDRDVMRQHVLWFVDMGVDFIFADWSNHIWGMNHWSERSPGTNTILHATTLMFETLAEMRAEGIPVPRMVIMPGLSNGPPAAMTALNEQLQWIHENYNRNPRFEGLMQVFDGKPLVVVLDTGALAHPKGTAESAYRIPFIRQTIGMSEASLDSLRANMKTPVDDSRFTIRWMSTQLQTTGHGTLGYWTWMDGSPRPVVTYRDGKAEAVTVTPAFFAAGGWKGPGAYGRRGGATYIETFKAALESKPEVVLLHQFNEFAGQPDGQGYGPSKDIYVDSYNVELSDDLEPVSLTTPAYRSTGGWGYYYLNLTRALLDLYRQDTPETTVMAIARPGRGKTVATDDLDVEWAWAGKEPEGFTILINGVTVARNVKGTTARVNLKTFAPGPLKLAVRAEGTQSRFRMSYMEEALPLETGVPALAETEFVLKRGR